MPPEPPPLEMLPLVCPHCNGPFQVRGQFRGIAVSCPHCQQAIEVPRESAVAPPPPPASSERKSQPWESNPSAPAVVPMTAPKDQPVPSAASQGPEAAEPEPLPELTREERERLRRRFRFVVAAFAAIVLAVSLFLLLRN